MVVLCGAGVIGSLSLTAHTKPNEKAGQCRDEPHLVCDKVGTFRCKNGKAQVCMPCSNQPNLHNWDDVDGRCSRDSDGTITVKIPPV